MFANVTTSMIYGMEVLPIRVEADISNGLPVFNIVGYASGQVREAQDRVRTALKNNGIQLPPKRITVNLAPSDIRKQGSGFDLPVAAAVMAAAGYLDRKILNDCLVVGELSLNGEVRSVNGILPRIIHARETGIGMVVIPYSCLEEASLIKDIRVIGVRDLGETVCYLTDPDAYRPPAEGVPPKPVLRSSSVDFSEILGQESGRRAAEIAVSGFHNLLMTGPPGSGKTMLARRLPTIMPEMSFEEQLELTRIYSIAGLLQPGDPLIRDRPFRSPHNTCTPQALTGGGRNPSPGEMTLAHRGVLFLDEMPEFSRSTLEVLRQPLEDRTICIARQAGTFRFPANFMLAAAMNPCPCGYWPSQKCKCSPGDINRYVNRISQPLLDRIDLCVDIPPVRFKKMIRPGRQESSAEIRLRTERVRAVQEERFRQRTIHFNGEMQPEDIRRYCALTADGEVLLEKACDAFSFSARSCHKILKVSRTIADMDGSDSILSSHLEEALSFRSYEKKPLI